MIKGIGTDIVSIKRIGHSVERFSTNFINRILRENEICVAKEKNLAVAHIAGRWAAKEAIAKALGVGIGKSCSFHDIEIIADSFGKPCVTLFGAAKELALSKSVNCIELSISHEVDYAVAFVVLC